MEVGLCCLYSTRLADIEVIEKPEYEQVSFVLGEPLVVSIFFSMCVYLS